MFYKCTYVYSCVTHLMGDIKPTIMSVLFKNIIQNFYMAEQWIYYIRNIILNWNAQFRKSMASSKMRFICNVIYLLWRIIQWMMFIEIIFNKGFTLISKKGLVFHQA